MILSREEERAALDSVIDLLTRADFRLAHVSIDSCSREVKSDLPGTKKFVDTGVRIVSLVMNATELRPDSYGPMVSTDVSGYPAEADQLAEAETVLLEVQSVLERIVQAGAQGEGPAALEAVHPEAKEVIQKIWSYFNGYQ
jgi:hypothetical protein